MDYDFITTCNWTATGTYTLRAHRGSNTDIASSVSLFYRKKGDTTWTETTNGEVVIASTGEWEIANDWNKSGNNCLTHSYLGITAINSCTDVEFNETTLGTTVGDYFLRGCWYGCTSLVSMPVGFSLPTNITTVGRYFLLSCWYNCTSLTSMPVGFDIPSSITSVDDAFLFYTWYNCTAITSMPIDFNIPSSITTVGSSFMGSTWHKCTALTSMPSGFNLPSGLTTVGSNFMSSTWRDCTSLKNDAYAEPITFEFTTGYYTFGMTCPITAPNVIVGTKALPVNIAVNRLKPLSTGNFFQFF